MAATVYARNNWVHLTSQPRLQHFYSYLVWENNQHFATPPATGFPAKWRLRNERRHSILMTHHYQDLRSASDWLEISLNPNQKHYPDLGSDASSVWNVCARFSAVIWRENQWWALGSASDWLEISLNPNQKHYPWNGYEISVRHFVISDVISRRNQWWGRQMSADFSGLCILPSTKAVFTRHLANFRPVKNSCV